MICAVILISASKVIMPYTVNAEKNNNKPEFYKKMSDRLII